MKRILFVLFTVLILLSFGQNTNAGFYLSNERVNIEKTIEEDVYLAGGNIDIKTNIKGDAYVAGGEIDISGNVSEDLVVAGGEIEITGNIGDDVRVAGGDIYINSTIGGDLVLFGGKVHFGEKTQILGDLVLGAGELELSGNVSGDSRISVGKFTLNGTLSGATDLEVGEFVGGAQSGSINGDINYQSKGKIKDLESIVKGKIIYSQLDDENKDNYGNISSYFSLSHFVFLFIFGSLLYFFFEKVYKKAGVHLGENVGKSFLIGLLIFLLTPVLIVILFVTVIGVPFGFFLLFLYIFLFVFLSLINVIVLSGFLCEKYKIENIYKKFLIIGGLSVVFGFLPFIGFFVGIFTTGAFAIKKFEMFNNYK